MVMIMVVKIMMMIIMIMMVMMMVCLILKMVMIMHDGPGCGSIRHFPDTPAQSEIRAKIVNILIL